MLRSQIHQASHPRQSTTCAAPRGQMPPACARESPPLRRLGTNRITLADSTHGICSSCAFCCARGIKKMLRPMSAPITSMICALVTFCIPSDFNVVARFHAEAPRALAIVIQPRRRQRRHTARRRRRGSPQQTVRSFFRKRTSAGGDALLPAQERRFLVYIQVDQARIVHLQIMPSQIMETARSLSAGRVQLLLQDGGTRLPRHQFRSVVAVESLSLQTITSFCDFR